MFIKYEEHEDVLLNIDQIVCIKKKNGYNVNHFYRIEFYTERGDEPYTEWMYPTEQERDDAFELLQDELNVLGKLTIIY